MIQLMRPSSTFPQNVRITLTQPLRYINFIRILLRDFIRCRFIEFADCQVLSDALDERVHCPNRGIHRSGRGEGTEGR